jgi:hypothetical protein
MFRKFVQGRCISVCVCVCVCVCVYIYIYIVMCISDLIRNRSHDFPACSIVAQLTTLPRAPVMSVLSIKYVFRFSLSLLLLEPVFVQ